MVALDLLGFESSTAGSDSNVKSPGSAAIGSFVRGEVVLAKYGNTSCFYWAKVKKVYQTSAGGLCDLEWLRPQAGAAVGKSYALHDGVDETLHGDRLSIHSCLRRPSATDLTGDAPTGARAASTAFVKAAVTNFKGLEVSDLLGELIAVEAAAPEWTAFSSAPLPSMGSIASTAQVAAQPRLPAQMSTQESSIGYGWHNLGSPVNSATPWVGLSGPQQPASAWNVAASAPTGFQKSLAPQPGQNGVTSKPAATSINDLEASFVSGLLLKSPIGKSPSSNGKVAKGSKEECFDFISDMMSEARK